MHYKYLSEKGMHYDSEEGSSGQRIAALDAISVVLKTAIVSAQNAAPRPPQSPGAPPIPAKPEYATLQAKVVRLRRWLELENCVVNPDGSIVWAQSTRVVTYDRAHAAQGLTQIHCNGGLVYKNAALTEKLDTTDMVTHFSGPGKAIFVMSEEGNIHVSSHSVGDRHHSSLLAGGEVSSAGELEVKQGVMTWLSNKSGHYQPSISHLLQVLHQLQKRGVVLDFKLTVIGPGGAKTPFDTVGDFLAQLDLAGTPDFELDKLMAYSTYLKPAILTPNGWRWAVLPEKPGVYVIATNVMVPHRDVRKWLKGRNLLAGSNVQSGLGR